MDILASQDGSRALSAPAAADGSDDGGAEPGSQSPHASVVSLDSLPNMSSSASPSCVHPCHADQLFPRPRQRMAVSLAALSLVVCRWPHQLSRLTTRRVRLPPLHQASRMGALSRAPGRCAVWHETFSFCPSSSTHHSCPAARISRWSRCWLGTQVTWRARMGGRSERRCAGGAEAAARSPSCASSLRRTPCGQATARLRPGCGQAAARLRPGCGQAAGRLRPGSGQAAARLRPGSGQATARQRPGCGQAVARLRPCCGQAAARLWPGCGHAAARQRPGTGQATARQRPGCGQAAAKAAATLRPRVFFLGFLGLPV